MPWILRVGLVLELAGLVGLDLLFGGVLEPGWREALVGFLPAVGSAVAIVGVWRARALGRCLAEALLAFAISAAAFVAAGAAVLAQRYDRALAPFAVAVIAQALGWCFLVAVGPRRGWRRLAAIGVALLVVAVHVVVPLAACVDAFARGIASDVLMSDVETEADLVRHRAMVRDDGIEMARTFGAMTGATGAAALGLLLVLWRRARPRDAPAGQDSSV